MSCEHEHHHGHLHTAPIPTNASQSLYAKIDLSKVTALNLANPPDELQKLFRTQDDRYKLKPVIRSDCDEQLILHIPFINALVKLFSVILRSNGDKYCPKTIKFWKNDTTVDFDNAAAKEPTLTVQHPLVGVNYNDDEVPDEYENDAEFVEHYLPRHVFTGVQHLTVFIEDTHGDEEETHLHYLELRGEFTELTKDPVVTLYELAANPADHKNLTVSESANYSVG